MGYSGWTVVARVVRTMEPNSPAEELPALYRAILDRVAVLEAAGERARGARLRPRRRPYSRAWDERARRQLEALLRRAARGRPRNARRARHGAVAGGRRRSPTRDAPSDR